MSIEGFLFLIILFLLGCLLLWIAGVSITVVVPILYLYVVQIFKMMFFGHSECHFTQTKKIILLALNMLIVYFLLPVFVSHWSILGAKANHDVIALSAWAKTCFYGILLVVNLPLLQLFQKYTDLARHKRAWQYTLNLWRAVWFSFILASVWVWLNQLPEIGKISMAIWQWAYAWWDNVFAWLEIGQHTRLHFYQMSFRYTTQWWVSLAWLLVLMIPFYCIGLILKQPQPRKSKIKMENQA